MNRRLIRMWALVCIVVLAISSSPIPTMAQGTPDVSQATPSFVFQPKQADQPYFSLELEAGTSQETTVLIGAEGDQVVPAKTYSADAYSLINGGFGVRELGEPVSEPTTWLDYESSDLDLKPGEQIERTFSISVPQDTAPGQYIAGLIVQTAEPIAVGGSTMLQQTLRKALAVLITVPGPITPELKIGKASLRQSELANSLLVDITNSGNVLLKPEGEIVISDTDGTDLVTAPITMGSVYAGDSTQIEVPIPTLLNPGTYSIEIALTDEATGATASNQELGLDVSSVSEATPAAAPVTVDTFTIETVSDAAGEIQLANVAVVLNNAGPAVPAAKISLQVQKDGDVVEDYSLSPSLALAPGSTSINQRYVPATGWQTGTYSFSLIVEAVDLTTGQTTLLQSIDAESDVTVP